MGFDSPALQERGKSREVFLSRDAAGQETRGQVHPEGKPGQTEQDSGSFPGSSAGPALPAGGTAGLRSHRQGHRTDCLCHILPDVFLSGKSLVECLSPGREKLPCAITSTCKRSGSAALGREALQIDDGCVPH